MLAGEFFRHRSVVELARVSSVQICCKEVPQSVRVSGVNLICSLPMGCLIHARKSLHCWLVRVVHRIKEKLTGIATPKALGSLAL